MDLQVFHVFDPFADELVIRTLDIGSEVTSVGWGQLGEIPPCLQLFSQMAERQDKVRERFVFKDHRVFNKPEEKILVTDEKIPHNFPVNPGYGNIACIADQALGFLLSCAFHLDR